MFFISYRRSDCPQTVDLLRARLKAKNPESEVFWDMDSLKVGVHFKASLIQTIWKSTIMFVLIGPNWNPVNKKTGQPRLFEDTDIVRLEISEALKRNLYIVPLISRGGELPPASELPNEIRELSYKGAAFISSKDPQTQIDQLVDELDQIKTSIIKEFIQIGNGFIVEGTPERALSYYSQAISLDKKNVFAYRGRGTAHENMNETSKALSDYSSAIQLDSSDPIGWVQRSHLFRISGQLQKALLDIDKAISLTLTNDIVYHIRAGIYAEMGRHIDYMSDLASCIKLAPHKIDYRLDRIEAYLAYGHPSLSEDDILAASKLDPNNEHLIDLIEKVRQ